jgi:two-component system CheB/CheR fusion protein
MARLEKPLSLEEVVVAASRRILVIEDDVDGGQGLRALLELWGHRPYLAETGRRGIARALRHSPEVIILDLGLADIDGCDVIRRIRAEPSGAAPIIIAYSGYHRREEEALGAGCDAFVLKPAIDELQSLLQGTRESVCRQTSEGGSALERHRKNGSG